MDSPLRKVDDSCAAPVQRHGIAPAPRQRCTGGIRVSGWGSSRRLARRLRLPIRAAAAAAASSGGDEVSRQVSCSIRVERGVAYEQAVPEEAVDKIDQRIQVGAGGEPAIVAPALQKCPECATALRGEIPERRGDVLVMLGSRCELAESAGGSRVFESPEAGGDEFRKVRVERPGIAGRHYRTRVPAHGLGQHRAL